MAGVADAVGGLTDAGLSALRTASATHLRGVAEHVVGKLTDEELAALGEACAKIVGGDPQAVHDC